jgi:hypothetical protein
LNDDDDENAKVMNIELIDNASLSFIAWLNPRKIHIFADIAYLNIPFIALMMMKKRKAFQPHFSLSFIFQ